MEKLNEKKIQIQKKAEKGKEEKKHRQNKENNKIIGLNLIYQ